MFLVDKKIGRNFTNSKNHKRKNQSIQSGIGPRRSDFGPSYSVCDFSVKIQFNPTGLSKFSLILDVLEQILTVGSNSSEEAKEFTTRLCEGKGRT
jgi:hypothetical protein